jgi:hypothetical protein
MLEFPSVGKDDSMSTINIELTFDQLREAVRKLPKEERNKLLRELEDLDLNEIRRRAGEALEEIWRANEGFTEDEVMADVDAALTEVRAERAARRPRH